MIHASAIAALLSGSNVSAQPVETPLPPPSQDIKYVSSDLGHAAFFSRDRARFGPTLALSDDWPSSPARYFETSDRAQCVSVGPPGNTVEFAVKRPIRVGERYNCLTTSFRVIRCFNDCRAAVVERVWLRGGLGRGNFKSYMYVDSCSGVIAFSSSGKLIEGIPAYAELLRGTMGILASLEYPKCNRF